VTARIIPADIRSPPSFPLSKLIIKSGLKLNMIELSKMSGPLRTLVIINNAAARARAAWPGIKGFIAENGIKFEEYQTTHVGDATTTTRAALRDGYELIAVLGGDGTLGEAASGFYALDRCEGKTSTLPEPINNEAALAILPAGTGDDFARGLAGKRVPLVDWAERLVQYARRGRPDHARVVDAIYGIVGEAASKFICLNAATLGIGGEVAARVAAQHVLVRQLPGEARFVSAALGALVGWRERRIAVVIEGVDPVECTSNLVAVANGAFAGGGMMFAPSASLEDGLIDVVIAGDGLDRRKILRELPRIRHGAHISNPKVTYLKTTRVQVKTLEPADAMIVEADGNVRGHTPAEFRVMPRALRIVC
jgi:diacylglycerol kinase (ATP)